MIGDIAWSDFDWGVDESSPYLTTESPATVEAQVIVALFSVTGEAFTPETVGAHVEASGPSVGVVSPIWGHDPVTPSSAAALVCGNDSIRVNVNRIAAKRFNIDFAPSVSGTVGVSRGRGPGYPSKFTSFQKGYYSLCENARAAYDAILNLISRTSHNLGQPRVVIRAITAMPMVAKNLDGFARTVGLDAEYYVSGICRELSEYGVLATLNRG